VKILRIFYSTLPNIIGDSFAIETFAIFYLHRWLEILNKCIVVLCWTFVQQMFLKKAEYN